MFSKQLAKEQPIVAQLLSNAIIHKKLGHAYLFTGNKGAPLKQTAILLAQTLLCDNKQGAFACETCNTCRRVQAENYADLIVIDGYNRTIKKEEVLSLQSQFMQTGLEIKAQKIYIIEHADRATPEALNSLLKFLEEPTSNELTAILLSENPDRLLPTILSRTQTIAFLSNAIDQLHQDLLEQGIAPLDAFISANIAQDQQHAVQYTQSEAYITALNSFKEFITLAQSDLLEAHVYLQKDGLDFKDKDIKLVVEAFCQIGYLFFRSILQKQTTQTDWWDQALVYPPFQRYASNAMKIFSEGKDKTWINANMNLLMDQLIFALYKAQQS